MFSMADEVAKATPQLDCCDLLPQLALQVGDFDRPNQNHDSNSQDHHSGHLRLNIHPAE